MIPDVSIGGLEMTPAVYICRVCTDRKAAYIKVERTIHGDPYIDSHLFRLGVLDCPTCGGERTHVLDGPEVDAHKRAWGVPP